MQRITMHNICTLYYAKNDLTRFTAFSNRNVEPMSACLSNVQIGQKKGKGTHLIILDRVLKFKVRHDFYEALNESKGDLN